MKRWQIVLLLLALSIVVVRDAPSQIVNSKGTREDDSFTATVNATPLTFQDSIGTQSNIWEIIITGSPATMSIVVKGCMRGNTCTTLTTNTSTTNSNITTSGVYNYYIFTPTWTGGTNPTVKINRTGTAAKNNGPGGGGGAGGLVVTGLGITAPGTVTTPSCPTGQAIDQYIALADGTYQDTQSLDLTTVSPPASPAGTLNDCWRSFANDSGVPMNQMKNRFRGILHIPGKGGVVPSASAQESAVGVAWDNSAPGAALDYQQSTAIYAEFLVGTTPNSWAGHAFGETQGGVIRASMSIGTGNFTGTPGGAVVTAVGGGGFSAMSALATRNSTGVTSSSCASGGCFNAGYFVAANTSTGSFASGLMTSITTAGADTAGCTNCGYIGVDIFAPSPRFTTSNFGVTIASYGTNASDYNFASGGVNAAGTAAGFWSFTGPGVIGIQAHAGAGIQLDIQGGTTRTLTRDTNTKCAANGTAANPSVVTCAAAASGIIACSATASAGTCVVNTTAVLSTSSKIIITPSAAYSSPLSVTCNTSATFGTSPLLGAVTSTTSFTINMPTVSTNPACFAYEVIG